MKRLGPEKLFLRRGSGIFGAELALSNLHTKYNRGETWDHDISRIVRVVLELKHRLGKAKTKILPLKPRRGVGEEYNEHYSAKSYPSIINSVDVFKNRG